MNAKKIIAPDMRNALKQVRESLGSEAVILSHRKVDEGIELIASDGDPEEVIHTLERREATKDEVANWIKEDSSHELKKTLKKANTVLHRQLKNQPSSHMASPEILSPVSSEEASTEASSNTRVETGVKAVESDQLLADRVHQLQEEVSWLRGLLDSQSAALSWGQCHAHHPVKSHILQRLCAMGMSATTAKSAVAIFDDNEQDRHVAWRQVIEYLANSLSLYPNELIEESGIFALVGPTGSGKTTTIAKIAAKFVQKYSAQEIGLISTDGVRMGANHQLNTLSQVLNIPVLFCTTVPGIQEAMTQLSDRRLVLVDTAGLTFRDSAWHSQLAMLEGFGAHLKCFITVACTHQQSVLEECFVKYAHDNTSIGQLKLQGAILTKLDEANSLGDALSFLIEHKLPLAYVTHGLSLIEDISRFKPLPLIRQALEFSRGLSVSDIEMTHILQGILKPIERHYDKKRVG